MIQTKIADTTYNIPSSWNDITFLKYCDIVMVHEETFMNRLSVYTGIEIETLNKLTFKGLNELALTTEFMDSPDDVMGFAYDYESEINIGNETYGKLEISKQAIQNAKIPLLGAIGIVKQYTGEDISSLPITKSIGQAVFFLTQLESSWTSSKDLATTRQQTKSWKQVVKSLQDLAHMEQQQLMRAQTT